MRNFKFIAKFVFVGLLMLSGCHRVPAPTIEGKALNSDQVEEFKELLSNRASSLRTLRALCQTWISLDSDRQRFRQILVIEKPTNLRLETLPINAAFALHILKVFGDQVTFLDTQTKTAYVGQSTGDSMEQLLRIPLSGEDLVAFLTGSLDSKRIDNLDIVYLNPTLNRYQIVRNNLQEYFELDYPDGKLIRAEFRDSVRKRLKVSIEYLNYIAIENIQVPNQIKINLVKYDAKLELDLKPMSINEPVDSELFNLVPPSYYTVRTIEVGE
ncbi:MAG: DUF4292 domain-containing protein [Bdellovibrionales bacterium]|nr:DUF4292 domain-containing protein [Bdellovibrionales bacterium]